MAIRGKYSLLLLALAATLVAILATGCGGGGEEGAGETTEEPAAELSGTIEADGSSTVGPLTTAAAEAFGEQYPDVQVTVGISGTGGGFERFCAGETDISDASRPIKDEEAAICQENGVEYVELQVAIDALTVVVNKENDWATCLTTEQLNTIWAPEAEGEVTNWNQVDPSFPDEALILAGPGTDSGTFDYFTDEINGEEGASRADYTASEDDNIIVQAVAGEKGALGYFGFTYFEENADTLNAVEIDGGSGCVAPSKDAAIDGSYTPLSRPLFIYVKKESLQRPEVAEFIRFYLDSNQSIAEAAQYIEVSPEQLDEQKAKFEQALSS